MSAIQSRPMATGARRGQGSPEFLIVVSFVLLVFLISMLMAFQKQDEAHSLQVFMDAKRVAQSVADNINMISKNGHGYYRYFSVPEKLYGFTDYEIGISGNFVEIDYGRENWAAALVTKNVTLLHLEKGDDKRNCVSNERGNVVISDVCGLSDMGCGTAGECDFGAECPRCDLRAPAELNQNSMSYCPSYGCSTNEWHAYRIIPKSGGTLKVDFRGANITGPSRTNLVLYEYSAGSCSVIQTVQDIEPQTSRSFAVANNRTYILALDVDSPSCVNGTYTLTTRLE